MDFESFDNEFSGNAPIPLELGNYARIVENACRTPEDTTSNNLRIIPKWVVARTMYLIDFIMKVGLFTRGRRREVIVLAALRVVLGTSIPFEDLIVRAKVRFGLVVTQIQLQHALQDIQIVRRQYKHCRYRKTHLSSEDNRILVTIRNNRSNHF